MKTFATLEQALKTNKAVVISMKEYEHKGATRQWIKARKAKGKKVFTVVFYEEGRYSEAV